MKLRNGKEQAVLGVGWQEGDRISIKLRPGVAISWRDNEDYLITLFRANERDLRRNEEEGIEDVEDSGDDSGDTVVPFERPGDGT